jgi:serine/threonine protein kinase
MWRTAARRSAAAVGAAGAGALAYRQAVATEDEAAQSAGMFSFLSLPEHWFPKPGPPECINPASYGKLYELGQTLGEGTFAQVLLATRADTGQQFACKLVDKHRTDRDILANEVAVLQRAGQHPHIVSLIDTFDAPPNAWALVFDLVTGGEVLDRITEQGKYSEADAANVVRQVALALDHRDLKPENLLLVAPEPSAPVKLCDFGIARFHENGAPPTLQGKSGTVFYMAPEVLAEGGMYGKEVDLWSLGVILYILLSGHHPFDPSAAADDEIVGERVCRGEWSFVGRQWNSVSPEAKHLVTRLLEHEPSKRATVRELLQSRWVTGGAASGKPLPAETSIGLRSFNDARRTLRAAIRAASLVVHIRSGDTPVFAECKDGVCTDATTGDQMRLSDELLGELRDAFNAYDTDADGSIGLDELKAIMRRLGARESDAEHLMLRRVSREKSSRLVRTRSEQINFDEFCATVGSWSEEYSRAALRRAFDLFDTTKSGTITEAEFRSMLTKLNMLKGEASQADPQFKRIWAEANRGGDGDGQITFEHFVRLAGQRQTVDGIMRKRTSYLDAGRGRADETDSEAAAASALAADDALSAALAGSTSNVSARKR